MFGFVALLGLALVLVLLIAGWLYAHGARRPPRRSAAYAIARNLACDPGEKGLAFEQWRHVVEPGVELDVWDIRPLRDPSINGRVLPTIIMVHGWSGCRVHMLDRIDSYLRHASRIVLYDLRGHGESGGISRLGHDEHFDLLELVERVGDEHVILASYSMGAAIAIAAAGHAAHPASARIRGVIAQGAYADFPSSLRRRVKLLGLPGFPFTTIGLVQLRLAGIRHAALASAAAKMACPLLLLHGERDDICPPHELEPVVDAASDAELHVFDGAAHSDLAEVDPKRHDELVSEFIERAMRGRQPMHCAEPAFAASAF